jgi:hypothetical protein
MAVSKQERSDFEQGLKDKDKGPVQTVVDDVIVNHPDTPPYYKGRHGERLDEDKDENKDGKNNKR